MSLAELRKLFESNDTTEFARMHQLAIIITLTVSDQVTAGALHQQLEAAIAMFENVRADGRFIFDALSVDLDAIGSMEKRG